MYYLLFIEYSFKICVTLYYNIKIVNDKNVNGKRTK